VIAGAQRAHLLALALAGAGRDDIGLGAWHGAALFDAVEILGAPVALLDGPAGAAFEHPVHRRLVERDLPRAADAGRDRQEQTLGERLLAVRQIIDSEAGQQRAHPAGDVEPDAAGRHDPALVWVEGRDAADREAVALMASGIVEAA